MPNAASSLGLQIHRSVLLRLFGIGCLALVLQIPIGLISGLIGERQERRDRAVGEVAAKWGRAQVLTGPALIIPYRERWTEHQAGGLVVERSRWNSLTVLPERLRFAGRVDSETRRRGIFSIPVYRLRLEVSGEFQPPALAELGVDPESVAWSKTQLAVGIQDVRAIQSSARLSWNGRMIPYAAGAAGLESAEQGIHAAVGEPFAVARAPFSLALDLNGSAGLYFAPFGRETTAELRSNWSSPSFQGQWLPARRTVAQDGFEAAWSVPALGRNYGQAWTRGQVNAATLRASRFGVDLISPVDAYRMAHRSAKHAALFLVLTFGTIWLAEVLSSARVHPIQYLLLGAAMCMFYLLELSLAEHLGFGSAYALASCAVAGLVAAYSRVALRNPRRSAAVAGVVGSLYLYLYCVLINEDYALLLGSLALFLALAVAMFLTRKIDWYGGSAGDPGAEPVRAA
jgi:inner membrane protein